MMLLKQERDALSVADDDFAVACQQEIAQCCQSAFNKYEVYTLLAEKEVRSKQALNKHFSLQLKELKLEKPKSSKENRSTFKSSFKRTEKPDLEPASRSESRDKEVLKRCFPLHQSSLQRPRSRERVRSGSGSSNSKVSKRDRSKSKSRK